MPLIEPTTPAQLHCHPHVWSIAQIFGQTRLHCSRCGAVRDTETNLNEYWNNYPIEVQVKWHNRYATKVLAAREAAMSLDEAEESPQQMARELVARGFVQKSRKYRRVICIGITGRAVETLKEVDEELANRIIKTAWEEFERNIEQRCRNELYFIGERLELDAETFEEFRKARKESGARFP